MEKFLIVVGIILFFCCSSNHTDSNDSEDSSDFIDTVYHDGSWRTKKSWGSGYYYSDGRDSWVDMLDREHRSNGEIVDKHGYIYDEEGNYLGYEYKDIFGVTRRRNS